MLVIFDSDGVLVDSEVIANRVLQKHLQVNGLNITPDEINNYFRGISMKSMLRKIETEFSLSLPTTFEADLQAETFACFKTELRPIQGVESVLTQLRRQSIPICVASSGSHEKMTITLQHTGLKKYFGTNIFSATEVEHGKPAPDLFFYAAKKMGVSPGSCVVIEDSVPGIQAALSAGMRALAYCEPSGSRAHWQRVFELGAKPFSAMHSLPGLLNLSA